MFTSPWTWWASPGRPVFDGSELVWDRVRRDALGARGTNSGALIVPGGATVQHYFVGDDGKLVKMLPWQESQSGRKKASGGLPGFDPATYKPPPKVETGPGGVRGRTFGEQFTRAQEKDVQEARAAEKRAQDRIMGTVDQVSRFMGRLGGQPGLEVERLARTEVTEPLRRSLEETRRRVEMTEREFENRLLRFREDQDIADERSRQNEIAMVQGDHTKTPQEKERLIQEINFSYDQVRRQRNLELQQYAASSLAALRTNGTRLLQEAASGLAGAGQFVVQMGRQAREVADALELQGLTLRANLLREYPDSPISILTMLLGAAQVREAGLYGGPAIPRIPVPGGGSVIPALSARFGASTRGVSVLPVSA